MKIFLDDVREPPDNTWILFRSSKTLISFLELWDTQVNPIIEVISLDHDLGSDIEDGYDVVIYLERLASKRVEDFMNDRFYDFPVNNIVVHSQNNAAVQRMVKGIEAIKRFNAQAERIYAQK